MKKTFVNKLLRKKTGMWLTAGVMTAMMLGGCSKTVQEEPVLKSESQKTETKETAEQTTAENGDKNTEERGEEGSTIRVDTDYGEVELPVNPKRVAVFDMGILDSMDYLGIEAEYAVPKANLTSNLSKYEDAVNAGGIKEPDLEKIFEFQPDLIIISGRQEAHYEELNRIAPTWYASLDYTDLMEDFIHTYTTLGQIFEKETETAEAIRVIEEKIAQAAEKAGRSEEKALVLLTNDGNLSAYGSGSRFGLIHDLLGVEMADAGIEASTHGQSVGYEYLAKVNPDILYVVDRTAVVAGTAGAGDTLKNELVESTNAYKNGKMIFLDAENWYLAGVGLRTFPEMIGEITDALE